MDAPDLISTQFLQHDSREHDPQLHVHGPTANKVVCPADGKVRALDYCLFIQWRDGASAYAERYLEALAWQRYGLRWETAPDGVSRQVAGVDPAASDLFSKRTAAITPTLEKLVSKFRAETGRQPTNRELAALSERASTQTRAAKQFGTETRDGQLARWAAEYDATVRRLGRRADPRRAGAGARRGPDLVGAGCRAARVGEHGGLPPGLDPLQPDAGGLGGAARPPGRRARSGSSALLDGLTDKAEALARHLNPRTGPQGLDARYYRADGESVFVKPHCRRYATPTQLRGEEELRAAAVRRGAPQWSVEDAAEIVARFARAGRTLSADQEAALTGILTSGAAVEVLNAPAGTGKSFLVGTLADTWPLTGRPLPRGTDGDEGGGRRPTRTPTMGRGCSASPTANARPTSSPRKASPPATSAAGSTGRPASTPGAAAATTKPSGSAPATCSSSTRPAPRPPPTWWRSTAAAKPRASSCCWSGTRSNSPRSARAARSPTSPSAASSTSSPRSAASPTAWEGPASLRLRDGDTTVVGEYAKHGRLVDAGTVEQAEQAAARAWLTDTLNGRDALIVVGSNAAAARLSNQLRAELVRLGRVAEQGVPLGTGPTRSEWRGTVAGVGDLVQARRNAWHLEGWSANPEAPVNRQTYRVVDDPPHRGDDRRPRHRPRRLRQRGAGRADPAARLLRPRPGHPRLRRDRARRARPQHRRRLRRARARHRRPRRLRRSPPAAGRRTCCSSSPSTPTTSTRPARPPNPRAATAADVVTDIIRPPGRGPEPDRAHPSRARRRRGPVDRQRTSTPWSP